MNTKWLAVPALCLALGGAVQAQATSTASGMLTGSQITDRAAMTSFLNLAAGLMTTHIPNGDPFSDLVAETGMSAPGQAVLKGIVSTWQQDDLQIQVAYKADKAVNGYTHTKFLARVAAQKALVDAILNTALPQQLSAADLTQFKTVFLPFWKGNVHANAGVN